MDKENLIQNLEGKVKKRTPEYIQIDKPKRGDEKLLKSHILLSKLYGEKGKEGKASQHYRSAVRELGNISKTELSKFKYFSGRNFQDFEEFDEKLEKTGKELRHYKKKLGKLADELGVGMEDQLNLALYTRNNFKKPSL